LLQLLADNSSVTKNLCVYKHRSNSYFYSNDNKEGIFIKNVLEGETFNYSLVLLHGQTSIDCSYIKVQTANKNQASKWPIINGNFHILMELQRGCNKFELETRDFKRKLYLSYKPRQTKLRVTPIYIICAGHDGYFQVIYES
jgi:hypothetical protein